MKLTPIKYDVCACPVVNGGLVDPNQEATDDIGSHRITIEQRMPDGSSWAICNGFGCFSKSLFNFAYEPLPSSRENGFLEDCRFASAEEALAFWEEHWEHYAYCPKPLGRWRQDEKGAARLPLTEEDEQKIKAAEAFYAEKGIDQV